MPGPVLSERDLAVLRSFARRIDPSDAGAHNNLGRPLLSEGADRGRDRRVRPRARARPADAGGAEQPRHRLPRERALRPPDHRPARAGPPASGGPRRPLGARARATRRSAATPEAIAEFQALLAWQPADVPAMLQLGLAEKARGNLDTATDWLARACAQDPASAVARFYHGEVLYNRGLNEPALEALRDAIARNPDYAEAHYLLAFVYGDMGRHEEAREATKRAIKLNPDAGAGPGQPRARALRRERRRPARPAAERPQIVEGGALAHYNLGLAFRQKGLHEEALREYRLALDAGEDRRLTLQAMAEVHLLRRELPRGARALRRARRATTPTRPSSGTSAASASTRPAAAPTRSPRTSAPSRVDAGLPARLEQPRRRSGRATPGDGGDRGVPARARGRPAAVRRPAQPRPAVPAAAPAPRGARRVSGRARRAERERRGVERRRPGAHGAAPVRGRPQRVRPRGRRRRRPWPARTTT